jgi:hypothetical protein
MEVSVKVPAEFIELNQHILRTKGTPQAYCINCGVSSEIAQLITCEKQGVKMKGIFVDGKPIDEVLGILKDKETKTEFNTTVEEVQKSLYKPIIPTKPKTYFPHSRVRKLTKDEIRKEYGIMTETFKSFPEQLIYLIGTNSSLEQTTIVKETGKGSGHVSGTLKRVQRILPEFVIKEQGRWNLINTSIEEAIKIYKRRKGKNISPTQVESTEALTIKIPDHVKNPPEDEPAGDFHKTLMKNFFEPLKDLNIKITIEGSLKITFGIEK